MRLHVALLSEYVWVGPGRFYEFSFVTLSLVACPVLPLPREYSSLKVFHPLPSTRAKHTVVS